MRALVLRQLRHHAILIAGVGAGIFGFELLMVWISDSIEMGADFQLLLQAVLPPAMQRLVLEQFGLASFGSAVAFGFKHPLVLVATLTIAIVLASIPAAERETGLLDMVLARPVTRQRYLTAHVVLLLMPVLLLPLFLLAAAGVGIALTGRTAQAVWTDYAAPAYALAPLLLLVGAYTLFFAAGAQRRGSAVAAAVALTLVFYMLEVLASMWDRIASWESATIFHYFRPVSIVTGEAGLADSAVLLGLAVIVLAGAFVRFRRAHL